MFRFKYASKKKKEKAQQLELQQQAGQGAAISEPVADTGPGPTIDLDQPTAVSSPVMISSPSGGRLAATTSLPCSPHSQAASPSAQDMQFLKPTPHHVFATSAPASPHTTPTVVVSPPDSEPLPPIVEGEEAGEVGDLAGIPLPEPLYKSKRGSLTPVDKYYAEKYYHRRNSVPSVTYKTAADYRETPVPVTPPTQWYLRPFTKGSRSHIHMSSQGGSLNTTSIGETAPVSGHP